MRHLVFRNSGSFLTLVLFSLVFLVLTPALTQKVDSSSNSTSKPSLQINASGLDSGVEEKLLESTKSGVDWLRSRRTEDFGWEAGDTPRAVLALASSSDHWPADKDLEAKLTIKQLEIELLDKLLRHNVDPITPARVSIFSLALMAACRNPRDFYGHNLIASLEKNSADQDYPAYPEGFGFSLTSLVSCLSGSHFHKKQLRHLLYISKDDTFIDSIDTRSMAIVALECYRRKRQSETLGRHISEAVKKIVKLQKPDGSFGNIHTTVMAVQALGLTTPATQSQNQTDLAWNRTAAALFLRSMQRPDGSFLDSTQTTGEALIAINTLLNGQGLLGLKVSRCATRRANLLLASSSTAANESWTKPTNAGASDIRSPAATSAPVIVQSKAPLLLASPANVNEPMVEITSNSIVKETGAPTLANVKYWIWIGPEPTTAVKHNISLAVPVNTTFFDVMRKAAEENSNYEFSSTVWPNGHYVHTISGHREQPIGFHYWLLYKLTFDPDPLSPPPTTFVAPAGVDHLHVQDGDVFFFWYKKL